MLNPISFANHKVIPLMLSPMAGVTNVPFRQICFNFAQKALREVGLPDDVLPGIFVNEMVAGSKIENSLKKAQEYLSFGDFEKIRSAQIWCLDGVSAQRATEMILENNMVDHLDLNFGCPAKKVTSLGGGSALPLKPELYHEVIQGVMSEINKRKSQVVVSVKFRVGIDEDHITYLNSAKIAIEEGVSMLTLHARMAKQFYGGQANWDYIKNLVETVKSGVNSGVYVFGNGDIFSYENMNKMFLETNCDGVAVGRGVVGRPWFFYELITGNCPIKTFSDLKHVILDHLKIAIEYTRTSQNRSERRAIEDFRVYIGPYLKGFKVSGTQKRRLLTASSLNKFENILSSIDESLVFNSDEAKKPRVKTESSDKFVLPEGFC